MNKRDKQNKAINFAHKGYVLYEKDLVLESLIISLKKVIESHDLFNISYANSEKTTRQEIYKFEEIHCLDQTLLKDMVLKGRDNSLEQIAEFKLIYLEGTLRGFYFRLNGFLCERRSVNKIIESIEKHYFNKNKPVEKSSYINWLEENPKSFAVKSKSGRYKSKTKILNLDRVLTHNIRNYINIKEMTMFQFLTGIIGIYYKVSKHKDLMFMTEYFDNNDVIGNVSSNTSYALKKNPDVLSHDFIKNDWVQLEKYSPIKINIKSKTDNLQGKVTYLNHEEIPYDIDFLIVEKDLDLTLIITYQTHKIKKDDMFLMVNKLKMIISNVLINDTLVKDFSLITRQEEKIALKYIEPVKIDKTVGVYDQFKKMVMTCGSSVAISDEKEMTFKKLDLIVEKIKKTLSKSDVKGKSVDISSLSHIDKIAAFIALDCVEAVYSDKNSFQLKKILLGYKLTKIFDGPILEGQYSFDDVIISRDGYINYCYFLKEYFNLNQEDVVSDDELIKYSIPTLLAGGRIKIGARKEDVTLSELTIDDLKEYPKMKHVVTNEKIIKKRYTYNIHYGISLNQTVPISFIGPITNGLIEKLSPVTGIGFLILDKNLKLAQVFEKGDLYLFGPGVSNKCDFELLTVNDKEIKKVVKSNKKATWFLDESLRL